MRLSDIISNNGGNDDFANLWDSTEAADEMGPIPPGEYSTHIVNGELEASRSKGTPGYKLTFQVIEGDFKGRRVWLDCWLTPAALPQTKRDLAKLGVVELEQLEKPLPKYIRCKTKVTLRRDDDGNERNRVKSFEVVGLDKPEADPFAPDAGGDDSEAGPAATAPIPPAPTTPPAAMADPTKGGDGVPF